MNKKYMAKDFKSGFQSLDHAPDKSNSTNKRKEKKKYLRLDITSYEVYLKAMAGLHSGGSVTKYIRGLIETDKNHPQNQKDFENLLKMGFLDNTID